MLLLFALCYITRQLELLFISYFIMLIHECAHLAAAIAIGLKPSYIAIQPFGINLRLKNRIINSLSDELILYIAGPLVNAVFAIVAIVIYYYNNNLYLYDFYLKNLSLFIINMLPIVPLDGGLIIQKIITYQKGYRFAQNFMIVISSILTAVMIVIGIYLIYINQFNFSVILLTVFMIGNIFTQKEKYNIDFIRELIYYKNKSYRGKNVKIYAAEKNENLCDISLKFDIQHFHIVFFIDSNGEIDDIMTETEILNNLIKQK